MGDLSLLDVIRWLEGKADEDIHADPIIQIDEVLAKLNELLNLR